MFKTKRKRAVVLALIAFFCTAAATYVAVDWKRFGGGFLAFFKGGKGDAAVASAGGSPGSTVGRMAPGDSSHSNAPALPRLVAATSRRHTSGLAGGAVGHKTDDDLFKYGDPAAGGIPAGSFTVAQNDTPGGGNNDGAGVPAAPEDGGPGVSSPAPAPANTSGGPGGGGLSGGGTGTTPPAGPPPATPPASPPIVAPTPAPTQSGTTDNPPPPPPPLPPVTAVPEASSLAMMSLGALFLAVAASRKRKQA